MTPPQACWIHSQIPETITVTGASPENFHFSAKLKKGWNLVGPIVEWSLEDDDVIAWGWDGQNLYPTKNLRSDSGYYLHWPEYLIEINPNSD